MKSLTDKQRQVLNFIENFQEQQGMAPTVYEISDHFGIKTSTAFAHLKALERKKELSRSSKARSITLANKKNNTLYLFSGALMIPLLGRVNAGMPSESEEYKEADICIDSSMLGKCSSEKLFALRIQGESMRDLGMYEGDIIIIEQDASIHSGDVVVALVNNEVTVKTYRPAPGNIIELHPANPDFQIQRYPASEVAIQGKVVMLQRQF
ncbi:MAG: repressor LexA [Lentisphaeria bacterium]|nr:repressor LexA [Lentisphaeria bacterium]